MLHPAFLTTDNLLAECEIRRSRRSGPGGQHRNKVETAVFIEHRPTGIRAEATECRSQEQNRQRAIHRLRVKLALEIRSGESAPASSLWKSRVTNGKLQINPDHDNFPAILAEALDVAAQVDFDLATAANHLALTTSQLVKFLKLEPAALALVNAQRAALGYRPYH